jgi:hypothetical protein
VYKITGQFNIERGILIKLLHKKFYHRQAMAYKVLDKEKAKALIQDNKQTRANQYDLVSLLSVILTMRVNDVRTSDPTIKDKAIRINQNLCNQFLLVNKTYDCIPLIDTSHVHFIDMASTLLDSPEAAEREAGKLRKINFPEHEIKLVMQGYVKEYAFSVALAQQSGETYTRPEFFQFIYIPPEYNPAPLITRIDGTVLHIYSVATYIPLEKPLELQEQYFDTVLSDLFMNGFNRDAKKIQYAYQITNTNKLNLFILFH